MEKMFDIYGSIVDTEADKMTPEDVCPQDVKSFIQSIDADDDITININSCGGSVTAGISIANMLKQSGHPTKAVVDGYACSIASVIACACDKLVMYSSSFLMIHNAWSFIQGDSAELRRQADIMDKMNAAIMSFYRSKFDLSDNILKQMMDEETWISGSDAYNFKLNAEVIADTHEFKIAASLMKQIQKFNKTPNNVKAFIMNEDEKKKEDESCKAEETPLEEEVKKEVIEEVTEEKTEEKTDDDKEEEMLKQKIDELQKENDQLKARIAELEAEQTSEEKTVTEAECEKRVSGMQASLQKQMNTQKTEFQNEIKVRDEKLAEYKNEVISLTKKLDDATKELQTTASALVEKENALATLNASVNTPAEQTNWKALKGQEFFDWYKKTHTK